MIGFLSVVVSFGAVVLSFFYPLWAWSVMFLLALLLGMMFVGISSKKASYVDVLSPEANEHLQKYTHLYTLPSASRDISSAFSTCVLASIVVGIVGTFSGFWLGLAIATVYAFITGKMAKALVPPEVLSNASHIKEIDTEIRDWMKRNREAR